MVAEIRELLRDAAERPGGDLDLDDVRRRARQVRWQRRAGGVLLVVSLLVAALPVRLLLSELRQPTVQLHNPPTLSAPEPDTAPDRSPWRLLAPSPLSARTDATGVWTGQEMIVWGGARVDADGRWEPLADGAAYDPEADRWRLLAPTPLDPRSRAAAVWTGTEMLVWSGVTGGTGGPRVQAAAYNPATDAWRLLPDAPIAFRSYASAVWTGREMVVWGGYGDEPGAAASDGAAFDPAADRWRRLAASPLAPRSHHGAVWTGSEMMVWGGGAGDGEEAVAFDDGAGWDPVTDRWRLLPPAPLDGRTDPALAWTGTQLLVWGGSGQGGGLTFSGAVHDPATGAWRAITPSPPSPDLGAATWIGAELFVWGDTVPAGPARDSLTYSPASDRWQGVLAAPLAARSGPVAVWTGRELLLWGGHGGRVFDDGAAYRPAPAAVPAPAPPPAPAATTPAAPDAPVPDAQEPVEAPSIWAVVLVAADDVLNVRAGPGVDYQVVGSLSPTAREVRSTGRTAQVGSSLWRQVVSPTATGWVNARFLTEQVPNGELPEQHARDLVADLARVLQQRGDLRPVTSAGGLHLVYNHALEHVEPAKLGSWLADPTVRDWAGSACDSDCVRGTVAEVVADPFLGAYQDPDVQLEADRLLLGPTTTSPPEAEIPTELANFHYLAVHDPGDDPQYEGLDWSTWVVYFDYRDGRLSIVGLSNHGWEP